MTIKRNVLRVLNQLSIQFAYGHREILLDYMKIPYDYILNGFLQHGVGPAELCEPRTPWSPKLFRRYDHYVFSSHVTLGQKEAGWQEGIPIGSPWLYLCQGVTGKTPSLKGEKGFVVFPRHRNLSMQSDAEKNIEKRIKVWLKIASGQEMTICLYHSEFADMAWHKVCNQVGVKLWCNGVPDTPIPWSLYSGRVNFLKNLHNLLDRASVAYFEDYTSAIFYAGFLRKTVLYKKYNFKKHDIAYPKTETYQNKKFEMDLKNIAFINKKYGIKTDGVNDSNHFYSVCDLFLGLSDVLTPKQLREKVEFLQIPELCYPNENQNDKL